MTIPEQILEELIKTNELLESQITNENKVYSFEEGIKAYDVKQIAELFDIAPNTVRRYAQTGKLPHFKLGDKYMFPIEDIYNWMKKQVDSNEDHILHLVSNL